MKLVRSYIETGVVKGDGFEVRPLIWRFADIFKISPIKCEFRRYIENIADKIRFSPINGFGGL